MVDSENKGRVTQTDIKEKTATETKAESVTKREKKKMFHPTLMWMEIESN